jgi:transcriptional regulator with XRE-family HTH domain
MKHTDTATSGGRLRAARVRRGLTQAELAARMDVTPGMISFVETGRDDFSMRRWLQATDVLGVSLDWLIRGIGPGPGEKRGQNSLDVGNEHDLRPNQHRRRRRAPADDLHPPDGLTVPVGIVGRDDGRPGRGARAS